MIRRALDHPAVDPTSLAGPIVSLVGSHPEMAGIRQYLAPSSAPSADAFAELPGRLIQVLNEPLLLRLLELCVVADTEWERLITLARRLILHALANSRAGDSPPPLNLLVALAHQCFATEYIYDESAEERAHLGALEQSLASRLEAGESVPAHQYALYACYRPLSRICRQDNAMRLANAMPPLAPVLRLQVLEPSVETELRQSMPKPGAPSDRTSKQVGLLYEDNPYPRWSKCVLSRQNPRGAAGFAATLAQQVPGTSLPDAPDATRKILIAGCGTGQHSIQTASRYPEVSVLAIDLSLNSLAYAKRKTGELGLTNIEYRQHDILQLESLTERFDLIESIGVLHHLADPLVGWRILRKRLKPRGLMRIGLYSAIARECLKPFQDQARARLQPPTLEEIRLLRARVRPVFADKPGLALLHSPDFYSASGCRDMFFHVMEHCYSTSRIAAELGELELDFLGFQLPNAAVAERYRARFPDDPATIHLGNWHRFELENPWLFQGMYIFWAQAKT